MNCEYEYKKLNTKDIVVDTSYQRPTDPKRVAQIVKEYNPCLVNAVKVSYRDGKYYSFDGAHTIQTEKRVHNNKDCLIECKVFYGLTWLDEVELFIAQNGKSRAVQMNDKFRAMFNAGDPEVVRMVRLAENLGITIDFKPNKGDNRIVCLTTLANIFKNSTESDYVEILSLVKETWGGASDSFSNEILKGMHIFYSTYKSQITHKNFVKKLSRVSPSVITREGKASLAPGKVKYARQILAAYNFNTNAANRLPDLL